MFREPMALNRRLVDDIPVLPVAARNADLFGIEIELEGRKVKTEEPDIHFFWGVHKDDSLRTLLPESECTEYVLKQPLDRGATDTALKVMFNFLNRPEVEVFPSYRTSIHVHMNYAIEPARVVYNAMTLSIILDELFTSQNGIHRIGNNFCLRARDAEGQIDNIVKSIQGCGNIFNIDHLYRYSSINFASLTKFGTIEYRSLECTTDLDRVSHWVDTIFNLKKAAKEFVNPTAIIETFNTIPAEAFLRLVLGDQADKYLAVEGYEKMLHRGMRLAQDLAYCATWEEQPEGYKPTPRRRRKSPALKPGSLTGHASQYAGMSTAEIYAHISQQAQVAQETQQYVYSYGNSWGASKPKPQAQPAPQPTVAVTEEVDLDEIFNLHNDDDDEDFS